MCVCVLQQIEIITLYKISREKFEPEPGFEPRTSGFLARRSTTWAILFLMPARVQISLLGTRIAQVVERRVRNPEVRGSNPGSGSNSSLEIL